MAKRLMLPNIEVVYEDNDIIIIDKPSNMLSVPGRLTNSNDSYNDNDNSNNNDKNNNKVKLPRSEEWKTSILQTSINSNKYFPNDELCRNALAQLSLIKTGIPRKKKLFFNLLSRVLKIYDDNVKESLWEAVYDCDVNLHGRDLNIISDKDISAVDVVESICGHKIYVVHRLDMETSGLLLFAKTIDACSELSRQFREREVHKIYIAKVSPSINNFVPSEKISIPIRPDLNNRPLQVVDYENGKLSETHYQVIHNDNDWSLIKLIPITGRTHQLRVHMAQLKFPILGDSLYAPLDIYKAERRLCLHSFAIEFKHPTTKETKKLITTKNCDFCYSNHLSQLRNNEKLFDYG